MMKKLISKSALVLMGCCLFLTTYGQQSAEKDFAAYVQLGYFNPSLNSEQVVYPNGTFDPQIGVGIAYGLDLEYAFSKRFIAGLGFGGSYAFADFMKEVVVDETTVEGYLDAGAVVNSNITLSFTYLLKDEGLRPYARLGLGYLIQQVELGDVPLELTDGVETEMFPDFKASGFGLFPELGVAFNEFSLGASYILSTTDLIGEEVPGDFESPGSILSQGLQIKLGYRLGF